MPPPYDSVVSIGGQSFMDGVWRLLEPALERLTNPLPIAIPGFTNAQMRVVQLVPVFPGSPPSSGALILRGNIEITGEALLHVLVESGSATIALGSQAFSLSNLAGPIDLPAMNGALSNLSIGGSVGTLPSNLSGGTGDLAIPAPSNPATLSGGTGDGMLTLPSDLTVPGLPLPAIVPVAVDLTHAGPLTLQATVTLSVSGPDASTRFGLLFTISSVSVSTLSGSISPAALTPALQAAVDQIVGQLALPGTIAQPVVDQAAITSLVAPVSAIASQAFDDALTSLLAETGRLLFPASATGASCDARVLPTSGDAALSVATDGTYVLQIGFKRASSTDIGGFPSVTAPIECEVLIGNSFVLGLLCCLVERIPGLSLPVASTFSTTDVASPPGTHLACCNFTGVTANFGGIPVGGGGISVCIDGAAGRPKSFSLVGRFTQAVPNVIPLVSGIFPTIATVTVTFRLPLGFDLDDAAALANLRVSAPPAVTATVTPNVIAAVVFTAVLLLLGLIAVALPGGWIVGAILAGISALLAPTAAIIVLLLIYLACGAASYLLNNGARTLLSAASLVRSPVSLPPGLFEAFGRFAPATVTIDDLEARGVLHTPTSVWGLLPRIGPRRRPLGDFNRPDFPVNEIPREPGGQPVPGGQTGTTRPGRTGATHAGGEGGAAPPAGEPGGSQPPEQTGSPYSTGPGEPNEEPGGEPAA